MDSKLESANGIQPGLAADAENGASSGFVGHAWDRLKDLLPDLRELYTEPLHPASGLPLSDRASLVMQSTRPWREFLDLSTFNRPTLEEANKRVGHNLKTYFYNYFLLACLHILLFSFGHFGTVFVVLLWALLFWFMYGYHPEDIDVFGKFVLDDRGKVVVAVLTCVAAVLLGHVLTLVISLLVFLLIVVGVHSLIRDNTMDAIEPVI